MCKISKSNYRYYNKYEKRNLIETKQFQNNVWTIMDSYISQILFKK